jgi:hypothetical protein
VIDAESVILEELEALAPLGGFDAADWAAVVERARTAGQATFDRRSGRRRRAIVLLAVLALAATCLLVGNALGITPTILDFWGSSPAGMRVVHDFGEFNRTPLPRYNPRVIAKQTRLITTYHLRDGTPYPLWVAPRSGGGFCYEFLYGGGCAARNDRLRADGTGDRHAGLIQVGVEGNAHLHILDGDVFDRRIASLTVDFEDGTTNAVPVLWVGAPIAAGFFFYQVPRGSWKSVEAVTALDADGKEVARSESLFAQLHAPPLVWLTPSKVADLSRKHVILRDGPLALSVAPSRTGGNCFWLHAGYRTFRSSCEPPRFYESEIESRLSEGVMPHGPDFAAYSGPVKADVARLELRFQDGATVRLRPVDGFVLFDIPRSHWRPGHRLREVVAYSAAGERLEGQFTNPDVKGFYGCARPTQCP